MSPTVIVIASVPPMTAAVRDAIAGACRLAVAPLTETGQTDHTAVPRPMSAATVPDIGDAIMHLMKVAAVPGPPPT
ncbi:MAG: hypothetical protein JWM18_4623 [Chloroflexi bacterium]|jgi:hypothetical protein|nr:hypothetical protein [Chloroflexota bacterium]